MLILLSCCQIICSHNLSLHIFFSSLSVISPAPLRNSVLEVPFLIFHIGHLVILLSDVNLN